MSFKDVTCSQKQGVPRLPMHAYAACVFIFPLIQSDSSRIIMYIHNDK